MEELAEHTRRWDTSSEFDRAVEAPLSASVGGMHQISADNDIQARITAGIKKQMQELNVKPMNNVDGGYCVICEGFCHDTTMCPTIPAIKETIKDPTHLKSIGSQTKGIED